MKEMSGSRVFGSYSVRLSGNAHQADGESIAGDAGNIRTIHSRQTDSQ